MDTLKNSSTSSAVAGVPAWMIYGPIIGLIALVVVFAVGMIVGKR